jgi:hypothetical protein
MAKTVSAAVFGAILMIATWSLSGLAADDKPREEYAVNFAGKIVMLTPANTNALASDNVAEVLKDAAIQNIGGRLFFIGAAQSAPDDAKYDWRKGSQVGVAIDQIESFYVFTPEQYDEMQRAMSSEGSE